jgi:hemerythrin
MTVIRETAVERINQDHGYMIELARRIKAMCTQGDEVSDCSGCERNKFQVCHGNIEQQIRSFVEFTLKHNLIESLYMEDGVPKAHRIAHTQAHLNIAQQMKSIRAVFSEDGNCILAIEGIDHVLEALLAHIKEFDQPMEHYLLAAA